MGLTLPTYGNQLEEFFLLKLYDFQTLLSAQCNFQFITEHLNEQKNAFIKEVNIVSGGGIVLLLKATSNKLHPSVYRNLIKSYIVPQKKRRRVIIDEDDGINRDDQLEQENDSISGNIFITL
jgi:hypothetical protein